MSHCQRYHKNVALSKSKMQSKPQKRFLTMKETTIKYIQSYDPRILTGEVKILKDQPEVTNQMLQAVYSWYVHPGIFLAKKI